MLTLIHIYIYLSPLSNYIHEHMSLSCCSLLCVSVVFDSSFFFFSHSLLFSISLPSLYPLFSVTSTLGPLYCNHFCPWSPSHSLLHLVSITLTSALGLHHTHFCTWSPSHSLLHLVSITLTSALGLHHTHFCT